MARVHVCLLVLLVSHASWAAPVSPRPRFAVVAAPGLDAAAAEVRAQAAASWEEELSLVGLPGFSAPIDVALLAESSEEARTTASWVAGYATVGSRRIVLFPSRTPSYPDRNREALLRHEVTHILIGEAAASRPVPRWLHEGIAAVAAREWGLEDRARFAVAVVGGRPGSTGDLDRGFLTSGAAVARSYALSAGFVRFLQGRHGADVTARLLARLAAGGDVDRAFLAVTGSELSAAEADFFGRETVLSVWLPFLTSSAVLWMGITLLALLAARAKRRRDALLRAAWLDVEGGPEGGEEDGDAGGEDIEPDDNEDRNPQRWN